MRRLGELLLFAALLGSGVTALGADLNGTWVGRTGDGSAIVWQLEGERLRLDGRPADIEIRSDTLVVRFDPPAGAGAEMGRETAVYRFLASSSTSGFKRLFVYGFDLGRRGMYLEREEPDPAPASEDAAPPIPEPPAPSKAPARPPTPPGAQARADR